MTTTATMSRRPTASLQLYSQQHIARNDSLISIYSEQQTIYQQYVMNELVRSGVDGMEASMYVREWCKCAKYVHGKL